jgi:hypothetical protein
MKLFVCSLVLCWLVLVAPLAAQTLFFDDFEHGVSRDTSGGTWARYDVGTPGLSTGLENWLDAYDNHNHTPGGVLSARAVESDPGIYNSYADFGATGAGVRATVYLFEDMTYVPPYLDQPIWKQPYIEVRSMFSLFGDNTANALGDSIENTDYLQIRLIPDVDRPPAPAPDHYSYGIRTKYNDDNGLGIIDTGILRKKQDWLKLEIEADSVADGGEVRFYIDDALVGTSQRTGADLRWVMMGATKITYENYWYDDISVVDLHGDYNGDGETDAADYVVWRKANPNNLDGYATWRENFGAAPGSTLEVGAQADVAVPEPAPSAVLALAGLLSVMRLRRG